MATEQSKYYGTFTPTYKGRPYQIGDLILCQGKVHLLIDWDVEEAKTYGRYTKTMKVLDIKEQKVCRLYTKWKLVLLLTDDQSTTTAI